MVNNDFLRSALRIDKAILVVSVASVSIYAVFCFSSPASAKESFANIPPYVSPTPKPKVKKPKPLSLGDLNGDPESVPAGNARHGAASGTNPASSATTPVSARAGRKKNQDIEVENDETHRTTTSGVKSGPKAAKSRTRKPRR